MGRNAAAIGAICAWVTGAVACRRDVKVPSGASPEVTAPPPFRAGLRGLPGELQLPARFRLVPAFPNITFDDPVSLVEAPGSGHLVVSEREGRLYAFENRSDVRTKLLMLDLSARTQGEGDSGLLGVVFHPEFSDRASPNRGYLYVHYAFREAPVVGKPAPWETVTRSRLARFTVDIDSLVADPASELVLIDQRDQNVLHQGGGLFFHPADGFLYLSVGDEGGSRCRYRNCQRIDKDLFSGVLRIDVDQRGAPLSHPIVRQPATGSTANYFIPNDNPFVGQPGVLEEFYALGLRNPYRMTCDPVDGTVWIGDVGDQGREEIDVLSPGANFQWNVYEGRLRSSGNARAPRLGVWTDPLLELSREQARSIIGGYVYRGRRLPQLSGKYIFADFSRRRIWALPYRVEAGRVEPGELELLMAAEFQNAETGITSFGVDGEGEQYLLTLGARSSVLKMEAVDAVLNAPRRLSQIGIFRDLSGLEPIDGFVSYSVQSPLWSDGAGKRRWMALPEGQAIAYSADRPWQFPVGTVFVKHFEMALDERKPERLTPLETRLLVAGAGGKYYGLTYKWNADATDAEAVTDGLSEVREVIGPDGTARSLTHYYPGARECLTCHNPQAGHVLGVRAAQLDGPHRVADNAVTNQLTDWAARGLFRDAPDTFDAVAALAPLGDESLPLQDRVRSYWDANCSMCHGVVSDIRAHWDARYGTPLLAQGVIEGRSIYGGDNDATLLIERGSPQRSVLYQRSATGVEGLSMPPLRSEPDSAYLKLLERWINSLVSTPAPAEQAERGPPEATK
jgi:glucose/arabinose dehydrogenase